MFLRAVLFSEGEGDFPVFLGEWRGLPGEEVLCCLPEEAVVLPLLSEEGDRKGEVGW